MFSDSNSIIVENEEQKFDIKVEIAKMMAKGMKQQEISDLFRKKGISPSSLSSIEKKINQMKKEYNARTIVHLFVKLCKKGII